MDVEESPTGRVGSTNESRLSGDRRRRILCVGVGRCEYRCDLPARTLRPVELQQGSRHRDVAIGKRRRIHRLRSAHLPATRFG